MKRFVLILVLLTTSCQPTGERALELSCYPNVTDPPLFKSPEQWKRVFKKVETKGTYTNVWSGDPKTDPTSLDLVNSLRVVPGDYVGLQSSGVWYYGRDTGPNGPTSNRVGAVFADAQGQFLFPGKAGQETDFEIPSTCPGGVSQKVDEDFNVPPDRETIVRVPERATQLLFSVGDCYYNDNSPKGDFGVMVFEPNRKSAETASVEILSESDEVGAMVDRETLREIFAAPLPKAQFFSRSLFTSAASEHLDLQWRGNYEGASGWSPLRSTYSGPRTDGRHWGWDIFSPKGTPLVAPVWPSKMLVPPERTYGKVAAFAFQYRGQKLLLAYGHLDRVEGGPRPINGPALVGYSGCTGPAAMMAACGRRIESGKARGMRNDHVHVGLYKGELQQPADKGYACDPRAVLKWTIR